MSLDVKNNAHVPANLEMPLVFLLALCAAETIVIAILLIKRKRNGIQTPSGPEIAEKPQSDNKLEQSRFFVERVADAIPSVLFVYDLIERRNVYVNQRSSFVIGYSLRADIYMGDAFLTRLLHPDDPGSFPPLSR